MICKKTKNTGGAGGHGMSEINVNVDFLNDCDLFYEYKKGFVAHCPHCNEDYRLSPIHSDVQCYELIDTLRLDGCPFCNKGVISEKNLKYCQENRGKVMTLSFELLTGERVSTLRLPSKFKPLNKTQLEEAWESLQAS